MIKMCLVIHLSLLASLALGQIQDSSKSSPITDVKSRVVIRRVSEFTVDSCLYRLLRDVVNADKNTYSTENKYYSLSFAILKKSRSMLVTVERWKAAEYLDYTGLLRVEGAVFLLREDYAKDVLFSKLEGKGEFIQLEPKDSVARMIAATSEPSLEGRFSSCQGFPIDLDIYIRESIQGYEIKVGR